MRTRAFGFPWESGEILRKWQAMQLAGKIKAKAIQRMLTSAKIELQQPRLAQME
jgi:hypothetical protein